MPGFSDALVGLQRLTYALALAAVLAGSAGAAPIITLGNYIEDGVQTCTNVTSCRLTFTALPAGKSLIVHNVSCRVSFTVGTARLNSFYLAGQGKESYLVIGSTSTTGSNALYQVNNAVFAPYAPGAPPFIYVSIDRASIISLNCTIAGELKP